jgi:outer membrane protein
MEQLSMRCLLGLRARVVLTAAVVLLAPASAFAQSGQSGQPAQPRPAAVPAQAPPVVTGPSRPLSVDEAVRLALDQNLGIQVERINPQLQDLSIAQARTAWVPSFSGGFSATTQDSPPSSFLSGGTGTITSTTSGGNLGVSQLLPWGTSYAVSYDTNRNTTNNIFSSFNPQFGGNLDLAVVQPLLRDFAIDSARLQLQLSEMGREIADVGVQQTIASTVRDVKNAYWDYKYALASLDVARESLELAQESLRNTRSRVEIGTLAPIDVVEAESEVAQREEAVILAEAAIGQTEDRLRSLIFDPNTPDFWNMRLELTDPVPFQVQAVDVNAAVTNALAQRTDLQQSMKSITRAGYTERFYRNQRLPAVDLRLDYTSTGLAGTQLIREGDTFPPPVVGEVQRPYGDLLSDIFTGAFPTWRFSANVSYPIGQSTAEASLARTRLEIRQSQTNLRNLELQVTTQVRDAARQLLSNSKRVDATRAARVLAERRLEAEEKKFTAGMSTSFLVFQAQRDLSQARNNELLATLDYTKSQVDFETVQIAPLGGGTGFTTGAAVGTAIGTTTGAGAAGAAGGAGGGLTGGPQ